LAPAEIRAVTSGGGQVSVDIPAEAKDGTGAKGGV